MRTTKCTIKKNGNVVFETTNPRQAMARFEFLVSICKEGTLIEFIDEKYGLIATTGEMEDATHEVSIKDGKRTEKEI